ncbi:twin-arginine translocation pathway signal [Paracoccus sp. JM45]|nr:twin-arginine translocation pathway signal [Paracoccus sp. JM45]
MTNFANMSRRRLLVSGGAALLAAGCTNAVGTNGSAQLDGRVDQTHQYLTTTYPASAPLIQNARGVLYMPLMTEAALGVGGAYGQGALRIGGQTVDYYSATRATVGFQAGAQQYAHVLIFQTDQSLAAFRAAPGWVAGAGAFYAVPAGGMAVGADTFSAQFPVVAMIFGQSGLIAGAAIEGTKYNRIIPSSLPELRFGNVGQPPAS